MPRRGVKAVLRLAATRDATRGAAGDSARSHHHILRFRGGFSLLGRGLEAVELGGLFGGQQTDLDEVERADEAVTDAEPAGARDRVAQRDRPLMLEQDERGGGVVGDLLED